MHYQPFPLAGLPGELSHDRTLAFVMDEQDRLSGMAPYG